MLILRDTIKDRVGEIASNVVAPTIYKLNIGDEWHTSYDITSIGSFSTYDVFWLPYDKITTKLPNKCYIKQVGTLVEKVHNIKVEDGIIPEDIFKYAVNVKSFFGVFSSEGYIVTIPEKLFANCFKAIDFRAAFTWCSILKDIPENLFAKNKEAIDFSSCFKGCSYIKEIPENLFVNNTKVANFSYCFAFCSSLRSIPENLFANNSKNADYSYCFNNCNNLQEIPEKIRKLGV